MSTTAIEAAVRIICQEIYTSSKQCRWSSASEAELLFELVACILGSQVTYEVALAAAEEIRATGLLEDPLRLSCISAYEKTVYDTLRRPLHNPNWAPEGRLYRFAKTRANHISRTVSTLYSAGGSLQERLGTCKTAKEARRSIVEVGVGIGPKQASLFLRNIDFTEELAILDTHLLRFMRIFDLLDQPNRSMSCLRNYETLETRLRSYAKKIGYSLGCVDQAIWIVMRVHLQEARA